VGMVKEVAAINLEGDFSQVRYFRKSCMMFAENIHRYVSKFLEVCITYGVKMCFVIKIAKSQWEK